MSSKFLSRMFAIGALYGVQRKWIGLDNAKVKLDREYNSEERKYVSISRPLLTSERIGITGIHSIFSGMYLPIYMYLDIRSYEAKIKNISIEKVDNDDGFHDIISLIFS
jgi:hypothetical protein